MIVSSHLRLPPRRDQRTHGWQCSEKNAEVAHLPPHEGLDSETNLAVKQLKQAAEEARFIACLADGLIVGLCLREHLAASSCDTTPKISTLPIFAIPPQKAVPTNTSKIKFNKEIILFLKKVTITSGLAYAGSSWLTCQVHFHRRSF